MSTSEHSGDRVPCPLGVCDGSGWVLGPEDVARPCECRERTVARARARGVESVIPKRFRGVSFDRPPVPQIDPRAVEYVRSYCERIDEKLDAGEGLWLIGDVGTGKTTLAMLVSSAAIDADRSVAVYSLPKLMAHIRRTYDASPGEQSYLELFDRLTRVDLLHVDDFGAEKRTDWVIEQLYALINERYERGRALVITSNTTEEDQHDIVRALKRLEREVTPRTVSRLVGICGDPIPLFGEDRRLSVVPFDGTADPL